MHIYLASPTSRRVYIYNFGTWHVMRNAKYNWKDGKMLQLSSGW